MNLSFKAGGKLPWTLGDDYITFNSEKIYLKDIQQMAVYIPSNFLVVGSIKLIANGNYYRLIYPYSQRKDGKLAIDYIKEKSMIASDVLSEELENKEIRKVCSNCNKTFCYSVDDLIKNSKLIESAGAHATMALANQAFGSQLTAMQSANQSVAAENQIKDYTRCPYCGSHSVKVLKDGEEISNANENFSVADELKKFKELLDSGVITQEEFDAKKKQLLGL